MKINLSADFLIYWLVCAAFLSMPLGTSPPVICGGLAALVWIVSGKPIKLKRVYVNQSWFWPLLVLIVFPWIGLLYTPDPAGFGIKFAKKTHYWLYALVVASIPFNIFTSDRLIKAFLLGLVINALVAILQFIGLFPILNKLASGLGLGYGTMAACLPLGILMASRYFRDTNDKRNRGLYGLLLGVYFFHLIILGGRSWFLTLFVVSPLIIRNLFGKFKILKMSLAYPAILGIMLLSPTVREQISRSTDQIEYHLNADSNSGLGKEYSFEEERFYMWRGAIQIFLENPILGVGTGGYPVVLQKRGDPDWPYMAHPHNDFFYMAVSFGVIGILALIWFFCEMIRNAWNERETPLGFFVLSTALVMLITGLFNTQMVDTSTAFFLSLVTGLQNGFPKFGGPVASQFSEAPSEKDERASIQTKEG